MVTANAVVVATNTPINDLVAIHTKQSPYRSYVIGASVPRGSVADGLYWDTLDPYHYVRLQKRSSEEGAKTNPMLPPDTDILIVGGEDHKTGQAEDQAERYARLEEGSPAPVPDDGGCGISVVGPGDGDDRRPGFHRPQPGDEPGIFIVTGDSGMGMTHGTIAGILLTDLIQGRANPWASLYDPARKTLKALGEFTKENLNVARQYGDWLMGGEVGSASEVQRNSGAIVRRGLSLVAVHRDEHGVVHERTAVCPHPRLHRRLE